MIRPFGGRARKGLVVFVANAYRASSTLPDKIEFFAECERRGFVQRKSVGLDILPSSGKNLCRSARPFNAASARNVKTTLDER